MRHQDVRDHSEQGDRRQIFCKIEARLGLNRIEGIGDGRHKERVSIRGSARHSVRCDHAAVARPIFNNDRLADTGFHLLAENSGKNIRGRAWAEPDDDLDRMDGIGLRHGGSIACGRKHSDRSAKRDHLEKTTEHSPSLLRIFWRFIGARLC